MNRWLWLIMLAFILGAVAALAFRDRPLLSWWSAPVSETFADDSWRSRWRIAEGTFVRRDSQLVTTGAAGHRLLWRERVDGGVAIDYDAEILPGASPCDLSVLFSRDLPNGAEQASFHDIPLYHIQIGAFDAAYSAIMYADGISRWEHLSVSDFRPQVGVRYHIRIEILGSTITASVDGREILRHEDAQPFDGGWFMLYSYYPGKSFTNVEVRAFELPLRLPTCALGDAYAADGDHLRARREFTRAARRLAGQDGEAEARYKLGFTCEALGDVAAADGAWKDLPNGDWRELATLAQLTRLALAGNFAGAEAGLETLLVMPAPMTRHRVAQAWNRWVAELRYRVDSRENIEALLALRERLLPEDAVSEYTAAELLLQLNRPEDVLTRFPRQRNPGARALFQLGRVDEVLTRFADQRGMVVQALFETGRPDEALARYPEDTDLAARVLLMQGNAEGADGLSLPTGSPDARVFLGRLEDAAKSQHRPAVLRALLFLGRYQEAIPLSGGHGDLPSLIYAIAGDDAAALAEAEAHANAALPWARSLIALRGLMEGKPDAAAALAAELTAPQIVNNASTALASLVIMPAAWHCAGGDAATWEPVLAVADSQRWRLGQRHWHWVQYLRGAIDDDVFLAQPVRLFAPADLLLLRAIRHEADDAPGAVRDYQTWLAMPPWQRSETPDPLPERFVHWRLSSLVSR